MSELNFKIRKEFTKEIIVIDHHRDISVKKIIASCVRRVFCVCVYVCVCVDLFYIYIYI